MSTSRQTGRKSKTTTSARATAPVSTERADDGSWVHDYDYVVKDLRKLMIVSLSLFAIIIVSGFFF